jgi:hypothetical protein
MYFTIYKSTPKFSPVTSANPWFNFQFPLLIWSLALFTGVLLCLARSSLFHKFWLKKKKKRGRGRGKAGQTLLRKRRRM